MLQGEEIPDKKLKILLAALFDSRQQLFVGYFHAFRRGIKKRRPEGRPFANFTTLVDDQLSVFVEKFLYSLKFGLADLALFHGAAFRNI